MKIVIVEDHIMMRDLLREICVSKLGHEVIGEATDGVDAIHTILRSVPDIVLLDLRLPKIGGCGVIRAVRQILPTMKILIVSAYCEDYTIFKIEHLQINGFLYKTSTSLATLRDALGSLYNGLPYFSKEFIYRKEARHLNSIAFDKILSNREQEVLEQIGDLASDVEICRALTISTATLAKHRLNISRKLRIPGRIAIERYATEHGFTARIDKGE